MAEPILLDRFKDNSYSQTQLLNKKVDFLIDEVREMKKDIRELDAKIDGVEKKLDAKIDKLDAKITQVQTEVKQEINTARWQVFGVVVAQLCSIGAIVWAVVSALKP